MRHSLQCLPQFQEARLPPAGDIKDVVRHG